MAFFNLGTALGIDANQQDFALEGALIDKVKGEFFDPQTVEKDSPNAYSLLGTPVYSNMIINAGKFIEYGQTNEQSYEGIRIDTCLFVVSSSNHIISTPIVGRKGTIKEYISSGDLMVQCEGVIIGRTTTGAPQVDQTGGIVSTPVLGKESIGNKYPEEDVKRFIEIMKAPVALEIESQFLQLFGSFNWVVDSYDMPQVKGVSNIQVFSLRLISDTPIDLQGQ